VSRADGEDGAPRTWVARTARVATMVVVKFLVYILKWLFRDACGLEWKLSFVGKALRSECALPMFWVDLAQK